MSVTALRAGEAGDEPGRRVRIAIVSPEIVARIRHAFASKGLDVRIDRLPTLELTIGPGPGALPAAAAFADALGRLVGPPPRERPAASARYQLSLIGPREEADAAEPAGDEVGARRRRAVPVGAVAARPVTMTVVWADPDPAPTEVAEHDRPRRQLSPREAEVMSYISLGMMNPDIADRLGVSQKTVKNHVNHIFAKLGARSRVEAVLIWQSANTARAAAA
jgi:DNA-binding CsgD family transcriptional regulator